MSSPQNRLRPGLCLTPLIGAGLGVLIGFVLTYHPPTAEGVGGGYLDLLRDAALNLVEFLFAVLGVVVAVTVIGREIYCFGRRKRRHEKIRKEIFLIGINFISLIVAIHLIDALRFLSATTILAISTATLIGEVGWNDPLALIHVLRD